MTIDVGERLRFVRERMLLSQRELAKRSGVTNSTISLIEANRMNPSIGALKRILDGIPIGLAEFFAIEPPTSTKFFYGPGDPTEIGKGQISYRQVGETMFGRSLQILHETYQPGADTGRVPLTHEGEEGAVIVIGRLQRVMHRQQVEEGGGAVEQRDGQTGEQADRAAQPPGNCLGHHQGDGDQQ